MQWLILLIFLFLVAGIVLFWLSQRTHKTTGLPVGKVIYSDTGAEEAVAAPLISRRYGLVGRPDYLLHSEVNGQKVTIPVEVKSRKRPPVIFENHTLQLAVYCLLVEEKFGQTPPYGLLRYANATFEVPFDDKLRYQVLAAADALRRARQANDVHRQHEEGERCVGCGYRHACGEEIMRNG